jgi:hypothetical protein
MDTLSKVIFLDIDGVLQPCHWQYRHDHIHEIQAIYDDLLNRVGVDYSVYDKYDVAAVVYDWHPVAVAELRRILEQTGASIVISSDWRRFPLNSPVVVLNRLKDFFRIYGMADYVVDCTPDFIYGTTRKPDLEEYKNIYETRVVEILEYVKAHPAISKWVAIDDLSLDEYLPDNAVVTWDYLNPETADKCIALLNAD